MKTVEDMRGKWCHHRRLFEPEKRTPFFNANVTCSYDKTFRMRKPVLGFSFLSPCRAASRMKLMQ